MVFWSPYPCYLDRPIPSILTPLPMVCWPLIHGILTPLTMEYRSPIHGILTPTHSISNPLTMVFWSTYSWYFDPTSLVFWPPTNGFWPHIYSILNPLSIVSWNTYTWYFDPPTMLYWIHYPWYIEPPTNGISNIDDSYQVSVHFAQGFQRTRWKCEKLRDDGRRTPSDGISSHCLWQDELKIFFQIGLKIINPQIKSDNTLFDTIGSLVSIVYFRWTRSINFLRNHEINISTMFVSKWPNGFRGD